RVDLAADLGAVAVHQRRPGHHRGLLRARSAMTSHSLFGLSYGLLLLTAVPVAGQTRLELVQTIPLQGKPGRLDHLALDAKGQRLFVANLSNASLDVVDLRAGKLLKQIPGQRKIQGVAYAPGLD